EVSDQMVKHNHNDVLLVSKAQQAHAQERSDDKIKRRLCFLLNKVGDSLLLFLRRESQGFGQGYRNLSLFGNTLDWLAIATLEGCAQRLMTPHDLIQAALQKRVTDGSAQAQGQGNMIGGTARLQLLKKPDALLRQRDRSAGLFRTWLDG